MQIEIPGTNIFLDVCVVFVRVDHVKDSVAQDAA